MLDLPSIRLTRPRSIGWTWDLVALPICFAVFFFIFLLHFPVLWHTELFEISLELKVVAAPSCLLSPVTVGQRAPWNGISAAVFYLSPIVETLLTNRNRERELRFWRSITTQLRLLACDTSVCRRNTSVPDWRTVPSAVILVNVLLTGLKLLSRG